MVDDAKREYRVAEHQEGYVLQSRSAGSHRWTGPKENEPRSPSAGDLQLIDGATSGELIAIQSDSEQTALQRAYQEIKQSEARLRMIIDTIPTLAWCSSPDGTGEFWNRRWHDYTGLSPEAVRGSGWQDAIHPEDLKEITDKWLGFLASGQPGEVEGRLLRFDGTYRWFLFQAEPLRDESGKILNWYGTDTDIEARAHLLQKYAGVRKPSTISVGGLGPWQKRRATELLRENLAGRIRLSQVAQECNLSVSHFARSFKATFGVSTHRWLVQRRIERSQELLIHTLDSLADIADLTGFADQAAFTRTFHQIVGISPGRWRRDHRRRMIVCSTCVRVDQ
jgi:PAS domain S-box-containing protein